MKMGKQIVYTCDICGKQLEDNPVSNIAVSLKRTMPNQLIPIQFLNQSQVEQASEPRVMPVDFDALVCNECLSTKPLSEVLDTVSVVAKAATSATLISAVTLKTINTDNALEGIPMNAKPIVVPPTKTELADPVLAEPVEEIIKP